MSRSEIIIGRTISVIGLALAIAILLLTSSAPAAALACRSGPVMGGSYRIIDGRACWYYGRHVISKRNLHWSAPRARRVIVKRTISRRMVRELPMPQEIDDGPQWPPARTPTPFELRFSGQ
jgi:hypothetical protein